MIYSMKCYFPLITPHSLSNSNNFYFSSPKIIDGQEEWEVEYIKEAKTTAREEVQFLVKWKGYSNEQNKWMSKKNLKNAPDIVKKFYKDHPNAPC